MTANNSAALMPSSDGAEKELSQEDFSLNKHSSDDSRRNSSPENEEETKAGLNSSLDFWTRSFEFHTVREAQNFWAILVNGDRGRGGGQTRH